MRLRIVDTVSYFPSTTRIRGVFVKLDTGEINFLTNLCKDPPGKKAGDRRASKSQRA